MRVPLPEGHTGVGEVIRPGDHAPSGGGEGGGGQGRQSFPEAGGYSVTAGTGQEMICVPTPTPPRGRWGRSGPGRPPWECRAVVWPSTAARGGCYLYGPFSCQLPGFLGDVLTRPAAVACFLDDGGVTTGGLLAVLQLPAGARVSPPCRDLLLRLLERDPDARISFPQFFSHPFVDMEHMPSAESLGKAVRGAGHILICWGGGEHKYKSGFTAFVKAEPSAGGRGGAHTCQSTV